MELLKGKENQEKAKSLEVAEEAREEAYKAIGTGINSDKRYPELAARNIARITGFTGRIVTVNPKYTEIMGYPCYPDVGSIPEPVDCIVSAVPNRHVPDLLESAANAGVRDIAVAGDLVRRVDDDHSRQPLKNDHTDEAIITESIANVHDQDFLAVMLRLSQLPLGSPNGRKIQLIGPVGEIGGPF